MHVLEQACYLPVTDDGVPVMGALVGGKGHFIAGGHSSYSTMMADHDKRCGLGGYQKSYTVTGRGVLVGL